MFRILIADDEGIMLASIKDCIESNFGSSCEIVCVKTGRALIEQAEEFHPDIAFVDIQMPGISGIQAIHEIRKFNGSIVFIIMTAYDKFIYAQEAVNLGVMEFVTKPVNKNKILDVCTKAMRRVESARQKLSDDLKIREKLEIVVPMIESGFIYSLLQDDADVMLQGYLEMLDIREAYGFMIVMEFGDAVESGVMTNTVGANVRLNKNYPVLKETVKDYLSCITGPIMGNRIVFYLPFNHAKIRYEERVEFITRTRNLLLKLERSIELKFRAGIGSVKKFEQVRESYKEALWALRGSDDHVVHITDIPAHSYYDGEYPQELERTYLERGGRGDAEGAAASANEFFDWMLNQDGNVRANIEVKVLELVLRLEQHAFEAGNIRYGFRYRENYLQEIQSCQDLEKLRAWFNRKIHEICENINTSKKKGNEDVIYRVKDYIRKNFAQDISLDDVSRMVDISPYYFSKLFKQEVGETYIEYLTKTRIQYARKLLEQPSYSIKQICMMCGYSDPNYFSRIFKKYEGLTPSEYRGDK